MTLQLSIELPRTHDIDVAVERLANAERSADHGAVFTRSEIVSAILDLCGYSSEQPLAQTRLLEPSFGSGEFLLEAVRRLLTSYFGRAGSLSTIVSELKHCLLGVELHASTFLATRQELISRLQEWNLDSETAAALADTWLKNDDFLLADLSESEFDFVIGNPPYVRQERIPNSLLDEYRRRFGTFYDRADLYVAFFERGLDLLTSHGKLAFICSNRWLKNKYGGPLRAKIARDFNLKYFIYIEGADAFLSQVHAYSAITVIERAEPGMTTLALKSRHDSSQVSEVVEEILSPAPRTSHTTRVTGVANGSDPWLIDSPTVLPVLRDLEQRFPSLEEAGIRVGIGVATGCDRVFIGAYEDLAVETQRKLPLLMAKDIDSTTALWKGRGIVNPYEAGGQLASFSEFPQFGRYLKAYEEELRKRHVAKKQPSNWYKTIDRIYPGLVGKEKLLIPDIKGFAMVSYDPGTVYPHHNLYVVTSDTWDLRALQTVLRSSIALMFIASYCTRMSGGFLRFQAQYLRRIRLPHWKDVPDSQRQALHAAAEEDDMEIVDQAVATLYKLDDLSARRVVTFAHGARISAKSAA